MTDRPKTHQISAPMLRAAKTAADDFMKLNPKAAEDWTNLCVTSAASDKAGGMVDLQTDYDWVIGFLLFHVGRTDLIPIERHTRAGAARE